MADQISSFEHQALEADMKQLATEIEKNREHPEMKNLAEAEVLKQAIKAFPQLNNQAAQSSTPAAPAPVSKSPVPAYAQNASAEIKLEIEYLLDLAIHQGIGKALTQSEKSPYFVQDAFHDALAGKLYPEMQKRGYLK